MTEFLKKKKSETDDSLRAERYLDSLSSCSQMQAASDFLSLPLQGNYTITKYTVGCTEASFSNNM